MYIVPSMIDLGLLENQQWPSEAHKTVASIIGLCNKHVTNRTYLTEIVQAVIKIPQDRIETVTLQECRYEFNVPFVL